MASRRYSKSMLLSTQRNLCKSVGNERLMRREYGSKLKLVAGVQLGFLLAKFKCMFSAGKGRMLRDDLAA